MLAEPHRRHILDLLREQERPVGDLVAALGISQPAVSKHLRVLRDAGVVDVRVDAQRRVYRLRPEPLREIDEWLTPYRAAWRDRLDALEFDPEPVAAGLTRVAVVDGRVVGFATTRASGADTLELDDLFVDPDWMRQGIATALIRDAEQAARAAAVACVEVTANGHALAFYRAVGFTVTGTVETRFGPGTRMRLDTGPAGGA